MTRPQDGKGKQEANDQTTDVNSKADAVLQSVDSFAVIAAKIEAAMSEIDSKLASIQSHVGIAKSEILNSKRDAIVEILSAKNQALTEIRATAASAGANLPESHRLGYGPSNPTKD